MSATERRVWYMQRLNLFGGLSKVEIEALAGQLHDRVLRKRQLILDPESRGDRIYLVKTGAVRVYQISQEGRELTTAFDRRVDGQALRFGTTGNLRRSDLVMWSDDSVAGNVLTFSLLGDRFVDDQTNSIWDIFGRATAGSFTGQRLRPLVNANHFWFAWAVFKPETRVWVP